MTGGQTGWRKELTGVSMGKESTLDEHDLLEEELGELDLMKQELDENDLMEEELDENELTKMR